MTQSEAVADDLVVHVGTMTLGTPVLLSVDEKHKLTTTPLSRVSMKNNGTEKYEEDLLQDLIESQPNVLPVCEFCEGATHPFWLGREITGRFGGSAFH